MRALDTFREFTAEVGGRRLAWLEWGSAEAERTPLVLLHDLRGQSHLWDPVAGALAERRVIALDLRGHGDSEHVRPPAYEPRDHLADVEGLLGVLGVRRCAVMGHGAGGSLGLMLAGAHPEQVERLVLVDVSPDRMGAEVESVGEVRHAPLCDFAALREAVREAAPGASESVIDWLLPYLFRAAGEGQEPKWDAAVEARTEGWKSSLWLARVRCPALVVRGEESTVLSEQAAMELSEGLDDARVESVAGAGHAIMLEQPNGFLEVVLPFLQERPPGAAAPPPEAPS